MIQFRWKTSIDSDGWFYVQMTPAHLKGHVHRTVDVKIQDTVYTEYSPEFVKHYNEVMLWDKLSSN